jgi:tetratricopeptide (TPR) repeat protein
MKMKSKYRISLLVTIAISLVIGSCTDDFVDTTEEYSIDSESYFNSEDDYYNALVGAYDLLQSTYVNVLLGEIASDNTLCGGESSTDVPAYQTVDDMIHTADNSSLTKIWSWMFAGVNRCNYFMEFEGNMDFDGKDVYIGEIKFLRAYYFFELVKWFGGIPLKIDERYLSGDETTIPRSSVDEVYEQIYSDLLDAIDVLPEVADQTGRVTVGAARSLLGKAYLYQEEFENAAEVLDDVINSGTYSLETDIDIIFEDEGENGVGSIFEVQYTDTEGASFDCMNCSEGNIAVGYNGVRNYEGDFFSSGFSFNVPVQDAVDAFDDDDPRIDVAILDIEAWAESTGATYTEGYEHTGYFNRKYLPRERSDNAQSDLNLTNPNNYRAIRYADVLLMAAEAYNRGGIDDAQALTYINMVRQRAFGDTDHDLTVTGDNLTNAIYDERRIELMGEGHRFFDLVRTGNAADAIDGFTEDKNELFPIPEEEIEYSNGLWEQNPGY